MSALKKKAHIKKSKPKVKPGILDRVKIDNVIRAKFDIIKIGMDKKLHWKLGLAVRTILPRSYHTYTISMVFDQQPFDAEIASIQSKIAEIEHDNQLFKDRKQRDISFQMERIESAEDDMNEKKKNCPTIEFYATVSAVKYNAGDTNIVFDIPDTIIAELNLRKNWFTYYRLELKPADEIVPIPEPAILEEDFLDE